MVDVQNAAGNPLVLLQNYCKRVKVMQLAGAETSYRLPVGQFPVPGFKFQVSSSSF
jgi:hypothetical protein